MSLNPALTRGLPDDGGAAPAPAPLRRRGARALARDARAREDRRSGAAASRAYPHQFSGGMRQRIMLASVLVMRPALLIADEPTTALDAIIQKEVMDIMVELTPRHRHRGAAGEPRPRHGGQYADQVVDAAPRQGGGGGADREHPACSDATSTRACCWSRCRARPRRAARRKARGRDRIAAGRGRAPLGGVPQARRASSGSAPRALRAVDEASLDAHAGRDARRRRANPARARPPSAARWCAWCARAQGSIRFEGRDVTAFDGRALAAYRLQTQMVFQDPYSSLDPRMTLAAIVAEGLRTLPGLCARRARRAARARCWSEVGLPGDYAERYPHELSGGQRQRVCIARAIVAEPALRGGRRAGVGARRHRAEADPRRCSSRCKRKFGFTYLFISHDLGVVEQIADRVVVMYRGRILELRHARRRSTTAAPPLHAATARRHAAHHAHRERRLRARAPCGRSCPRARRLRLFLRGGRAGDARGRPRPRGRTPMTGMMKTILLLIAGLLAGCASLAPPAPDLILYNAKVHTVDDAQPVAEAVADRGRAHRRRWQQRIGARAGRAQHARPRPAGGDGAAGLQRRAHAFRQCARVALPGDADVRGGPGRHAARAGEGHGSGAERHVDHRRRLGNDRRGPLGAAGQGGLRGLHARPESDRRHLARTIRCSSGGTTARTSSIPRA